MSKIEQVSDLVGHTIKEIRRTSDELIFILESGEACRFYHGQDCSEDVSIDDVVGDLDDLIGSPLLLAEEVAQGTSGRDRHVGRLRQHLHMDVLQVCHQQGICDRAMVWQSNGYYSERVNLR